MPHYHFTIECRGLVHPDPDGTTFDGDAGAVAYAKRLIGELKAGGGYDDPAYVMVVTEAAGNEVARIPFSSN